MEFKNSIFVIREHESEVRVGKFLCFELYFGRHSIVIELPRTNASEAHPCRESKTNENFSVKGSQAGNGWRSRMGPKKLYC